MSSLLTCSNCIPEDIRNDIIALQDTVSVINSLMEADKFSEEWAEKRRALNVQIKEFNRKQLIKGLFGSEIKDTTKLLPLYIGNHTCIQATQKVSMSIKSIESTVFITYRKRIIGFNELFKAQTNLCTQYRIFYGRMIALSCCVFENACVAVDGKYVYGRKGPGGKNPYQSSLIRISTEERIVSADVNSISKIKKYLTQVFISICGDDIAPITGKMVRTFITGVCFKLSVEELIDKVFMMYVNNKLNIKRNDDEISISEIAGISRHVSWCTYRTTGKHCTLLDQPCHASVDCAFYRESSLKRKTEANFSY